MKFIILGLGSFGASLAVNLTHAGHEVIGIDNSMEKVELYKDKISHTINMDSTDQFTMGGLPWRDTDMAIVAIGENPGANIMTTAVLKNLNVKKIISRAISPLHETVIRAMGIENIVHPEEEAAKKWAKKLTIKHLEDSFELNKNFSIVEVHVPEKFAGKTIGEIGFRDRYNLVVLTTLRIREIKERVGNDRFVNEVKGVAGHDTVINQDDLVVLYGMNKDIERFLAE